MHTHTHIHKITWITTYPLFIKCFQGECQATGMPSSCFCLCVALPSVIEGLFLLSDALPAGCLDPNVAPCPRPRWRTKVDREPHMALMKTLQHQLRKSEEGRIELGLIHMGGRTWPFTSQRVRGLALRFPCRCLHLPEQNIYKLNLQNFRSSFLFTFWLWQTLHASLLCFKVKGTQTWAQLSFSSWGLCFGLWMKRMTWRIFYFWFCFYSMECSAWLTQILLSYSSLQQSCGLFRHSVVDLRDRKSVV